MDLPLDKPVLKAPNFDDFDWDKQELEMVLDGLHQDVVQLQETAELVMKYAQRIARR